MCWCANPASRAATAAGPCSQYSPTSLSGARWSRRCAQAGPGSATSPPPPASSSGRTIWKDASPTSLAGWQSVWGYSEAEMLGHTAAQFTALGETDRVRDWLASHQQPDGSFRDLE